MDQYVEALDPFREGPYGRAVPHVQLLVSGVIGQGFRRRLSDVGGNRFGTTGRKGPRKGEPDSAGPSGDQHTSARDAKIGRTFRTMMFHVLFVLLDCAFRSTASIAARNPAASTGRL